MYFTQIHPLTKISSVYVSPCLCTEVLNEIEKTNKKTLGKQS